MLFYRAASRSIETASWLWKGNNQDIALGIRRGDVGQLSDLTTNHPMAEIADLTLKLNPAKASASAAF